MEHITASTIIDALGGTTAVAKLCDIKPPSVSGWRSANRIPRAQMNYLKAIRPDVFVQLGILSKRQKVKA